MAGIVLTGGGASAPMDMENEVFDVLVEDIGSYAVGYEVTITITGCVGMVSIPPDSMMGKPKIGIKVYTQNIKKTGNAQIEEIRKMVEGDMTDIEDD